MIIHTSNMFFKLLILLKLKITISTQVSMLQAALNSNLKQLALNNQYAIVLLRKARPYSLCPQA